MSVCRHGFEGHKVPSLGDTSTFLMKGLLGALHLYLFMAAFVLCVYYAAGIVLSVCPRYVTYLLQHLPVMIPFYR